MNGWAPHGVRRDRHILTMNLKRLAKFDEAEKPHHHQFWKDIMGFFCENHPSTLVSRNIPSMVLQRLGKHDEELLVARSALKYQRLVLCKETLILSTILNKLLHHAQFATSQRRRFLHAPVIQFICWQAAPTVTCGSLKRASITRQ